MKYKKWINFGIGFCCLFLSFLILPVLHHCIPGSRALRQVSVKENIDTNALFYSEESRSSESKKIIEEKLESIQPSSVTTGAD